MKYHNDKNYYIPNLVNKEINGVNEYRYLNDENALLQHILNHTCDSMTELLQQYPNVLDPEEIFSLIDRNYKKIMEFHLNPDYCYQYFASCHCSFQGVRIHPIDSFETPYLYRMNMTTNIGSFYQRRVDFVYDAEGEALFPNSIIEVEKKNGIVIQTHVHSKVLRKKEYPVF